MSLEKEKESAGEILDMKVLRQLYTYVKPYQKQFYFLVFLTIALAILAPTRPYFIQIAIDEHVALGDVPGLIQIIYLLVVLMVIQALAQWAHT
ncbi:MAG: ABC transporter ATP-binding protein, partial [Cyclobacteriaceae bacterium]|nr:ABC transporter ATP-binding protein [Cyclobacteriaceae bacterium]